MSVFFGNPAPLGRVRGSLQQFVRERVLQGATMTPGHLAEAVDRLVEDMQADVEATCVRVTHCANMGQIH